MNIITYVSCEFNFDTSAIFSCNQTHIRYSHSVINTFNHISQMCSKNVIQSFRNYCRTAWSKHLIVNLMCIVWFFNSMCSIYTSRFNIHSNKIAQRTIEISGLNSQVLPFSYSNIMDWCKFATFKWRFRLFFHQKKRIKLELFYCLFTKLPT